MRAETKAVMQAFLKRKACTRQRTYTDGDTVYLHRNKIAWWDDEAGTICLTLAGWGTSTTRERLNGLCDLLGLRREFNQSKHEQYFGRFPIGTSEVIEIPVKDGVAQLRTAEEIIFRKKLLGDEPDIHHPDFGNPIYKQGVVFLDEFTSPEEQEFIKAFQIRSYTK